MKKVLKIFFVIVLIIGLCFLGHGIYKQHQKIKVAEKTKKLSNSVDSLVNQDQLELLDEIQRKQEEKKLAKQVIQLYEDEYQTNNIAGVLELNNGQLREPVIHDPQMNYLRKLPNGDYSIGGTVIIYGGNQTSSEDNYAVYYGHGMKDGTKFGPLLEYDEDMNNVVNIKIYSNDGIRDMELISYTIIDIDFFEDLELTTNEEVKDYLNKSKEISRIVYQTNQPLEEDDFVATLSTCAVYGGKERAVAIYKEVH